MCEFIISRSNLDVDIYALKSENMLVKLLALKATLHFILSGTAIATPLIAI
jgi:hypothetical protein